MYFHNFFFPVVLGIDIMGKIQDAINWFFGTIFEGIIDFFIDILQNVMATSLLVLKIGLVQNGIFYAQMLAFTLLVIKATFEAFQTYILYQNGDPDSDPSGLLIRTGQAIAIIATLPWFVPEIFKFGTKLLNDVSNINSGGNPADASIISTAVGALIATQGGIVIIVLAIIVAVMILIVAIQAAIRGAELALMSIIGPILALNLTANNRSIWSQWFKQLIIICTSQALQIFMIRGAISLVTDNINPDGAVGPYGLILVVGWLWVTIKTPSFIKQFAYSTGFTGTVGGTAKQAGSMYLMRKMMVR